MLLPPMSVHHLYLVLTLCTAVYASTTPYVVLLQSSTSISSSSLAARVTSTSLAQELLAEAAALNATVFLGLLTGSSLGLGFAIPPSKGRLMQGSSPNELPLLFLNLTEQGQHFFSDHPYVLFLEEDIIFSGKVIQSTVSPALDRIDQRQLPLSGSFSYSQRGAGVDLYVLDSGILSSHKEFLGRITPGANFAPDQSSSDTDDAAGHGTCVSSIAAGSTFGVAKSAQIIPVRVYDASNSGPLSQVLMGVNWILGSMASRRRSVVINMSFGGAGSDIMDAGVQRLLQEGGVVVVAAGNAGGDACSVSPARSPGVLSMGATDLYDNIASFSNIGPCVRLFSPGTNVPCASTGSDTSLTLLSGTSMSAPLASGTAALYLEANPTSHPSQVVGGIVCGATLDAVSSPPGTTSSMLFSFPSGWPPLNEALCGISSSALPSPTPNALTSLLLLVASVALLPLYTIF